MPLSPGDKLGPYEIVSPLGAGGMGDVYKARDTRLNRDVALKTSKLEFTERFEREARAVAALNHPNICTLHDVGPNYLVMELVDGQPLKGPLNLDKTLLYASQICDALHAAHAKGITHRDLKPANILVTRQGIKLLDFGLAKLADPRPVSDETVTRALTGEGIVLGTPQYMAPEQIEGREADPRTDIFALGCVLHEMFTGRRAFEGKTASAVAAAILAKDPDPVSHPALQRLIHTCLAKDPDDRWQSARDVKIALASVTDSQPAPKPASKLWPALAFTAAALVLAAYLLRPTPPADLLRFDLHGLVIDTTALSLPVISPDGRKIAHLSNRNDGRRQIFLRRLDSLSSTPVPGTEGAIEFSWSPDSNLLAFTNNSAVHKVELATGAVSTLSESGGGVPAWTSNGTIVFTAPVRRVLLRVSENGGAPAPAIPIGNDTAHRFPSPCGNDGQFLFRATRQDGSGVWRLASTANTSTPIDIPDAATLSTCATVPAFPFPRHYLIDFANGAVRARQLDLRNGTLSGPVVPILSNLSVELPPPGAARPFFTASNTGVLAARPSFSAASLLTWFDRGGAKLSDVPPGAWPSLSPDEKRVIVLRAGMNWIIDLARSTAMRITPDNSFGGLAAWSPDGKHIAIGTSAEIVEFSADDPSQRRTIARTPNWVQQYSPDGKSVLFVNTTRMSLDLADTAGKTAPIQIAPPGPSYFPATFSPDGRFIAYSSAESGRLEVYVRAVPPATGKWLVSNNGGGMAAWRGDGRELFYLSTDLDMMAVDVSTSPSFQAATPKALFRAKVSGNNNARNNYAVSRDGQRFLIVSPSAEQTPLTLVVNWPSLLNNP